MNISDKPQKSTVVESKTTVVPFSMVHVLIVVFSFGLFISVSNKASANWINPVWEEVDRQYAVDDYFIGGRVLFETKEEARDYEISHLFCYEGSVIVDCSFCRWVEENQFVAAWELTYTNTAGQWTVTCGSRHTPVVIKYDQICPDSAFPLAKDSDGDGIVDRCYTWVEGREQGRNDCQTTPSSTEGNPINIGVGNKYQVETDYTGNNAHPLMVSRTYNSIDSSWQYFPELQLDDGVSWAGVIRSDGKLLVFTNQVSGDWRPDPDVTGILESFDDGTGTITGWRYTTLDNQVEEYDSSGKVTSITSREGLSHTFSYTSADITVTHLNGDQLVYQLDGSGRITGFITPDNQTYLYSYDNNERLISITYPDSSGVSTYQYEDTNFLNALTGITDANGERFATWAYDPSGRAVSSEHSGGAENVVVDYTYLGSSSDPRVIATNALGKQTTYHFADIFGARKIVEVEGHQSSNCAAANKNYTYDTNGFIASKTDWKGNTTTYARNAIGQELSRTEAFGTPDARTITTEWHATFNLRTKVTEPDSETTYTYDASGNLLSQQAVDLGAGP